MKHARRDFLKQTCLLGAAALGLVRPASGQEAGPTPKAKPMPMVPFGPHKISRLVLGSNPVRAVTHTAPMEMNRALREFYSAERIRELL